MSLRLSLEFEAFSLRFLKGGLLWCVIWHYIHSFSTHVHHIYSAVMIEHDHKHYLCINVAHTIITSPSSSVITSSSLHNSTAFIRYRRKLKSHKGRFVKLTVVKDSEKTKQNILKKWFLGIIRFFISYDVTGSNL